jgi:hypothetical protein
VVVEVVVHIMVPIMVVQVVVLKEETSTQMEVAHNFKVIMVV